MRILRSRRSNLSADDYDQSPFIVMTKGGYTYILTNKGHTVLYTGVTANIKGRITEHLIKFHPTSFTAKYNCNKLVWYQFFETIVEAIEEEKRIKGGSRQKKLNLINTLNPEWKDLYPDLPDEV